MNSNLGNLRYKIDFCSSQNEDHSIEEIFKPHKNSLGWESAIYCSYPQEIVLGFEGLVAIEKFSLMSHQYKISSKVEVSINSEDVPEEAFHKVGYFHLSDNSGSDYKCRELKTIFLKMKARQLKLVFFEPHEIPRNQYNQIGVIAIEVFGQGIEYR